MSRRMVVALMVVVVVALIGGGTLTGIALSRQADDAARDHTRQQVLTAVRTAATTMLTADPQDPDAYVTAVLGVTTGALHERLASNRDVLRESIAAQPDPATGQVVDAGLESLSGDDATALVVMEATNPALLGGTDSRIVATFTMQRVSGRWLTAASVVVS